MSFRVLLPLIVAGVVFIVHERLSIFYTEFVIKNYGISFGQNLPGTWILIVTFLGIIFWLYLKEKNIALVMILAGGLVNFIDRVRFGSVRDYWQLGSNTIYNNINDWLIFLGILLFFFKFLWTKKLK